MTQLEQAWENPYLGLFNGSGEISYTIEISLIKQSLEYSIKSPSGNNELKKKKKICPMIRTKK